VIGPGALGIVAAVRLHDAGHDVMLAVRSAAKAERLAGGVTMVARDGTRTTRRVPLVHTANQVTPMADLLIHTTKCDVAPAVLNKWLPALAHTGHVVPFQNGIIGDDLQSLAGERYLEASVYFPATLTAEGISTVTGPGHIVVGPWPHGEAGPDSAAADVARVLDAIVPAHADGDMLAVKWSKLILNAAMTSLGVITGAKMRAMMADRATRDAFLDALAEGMAVMAAAGVAVVNVGDSKPRTMARLPRWAQHLVLRAIARKYGETRSSSAQSLARGEKTEVEFLNGVIVREGRKLGVQTPANAALRAAVVAVEAGTLEPGIAIVATHVQSRARRA
jgi:2-dehydropantoate 2-reductase